MYQLILIIICLFSSIFAKSSSDVIKAEKSKINIHSIKQKELEAKLLSKQRVSKHLNHSNVTLTQKILGAELIEKAKASKSINLKFNKYKQRLNIEQFITIEDNDAAMNQVKVHPNQEKIDYYHDLKINPIAEHPYENSRECENTDAGATDPYGDGCDAYANYPSWCGNYDDDDFQSMDMCCACDGGEESGDTGGDDSGDDGASTCEDSEYSLSCDGGSYTSEVSWTLSDGTEGGAPYSGAVCLADGDYTLSMVDSYGDSWNGNTWTLIDADGNTAASCTLDGVNDDGAAGDCSFSLGGDPPVAGCTNPNAPNYNADAEVDDGTCELYCSDTQWMCASGDQCVPASYVCDGSSEWGNAGWGPDCADGTDETLESCCEADNYTGVAECDNGADGDSDSGDTGGELCGNNDWVGDGYCDGINNFEECEFDGGDCCESTCISANYDCSETNGDWGPCLTNICVDPNGDNDGCEDNSDTSGDDGNDDSGDDDPGTGDGGECGDDQVLDCSGDGDCCSAGWIGDGYADCEDQNWGCDLTCYENDGGDCDEGSTGDDNGGFECEDLGQDNCYMLEGCIWTENGCVEDSGGDTGEECGDGTIDDCSDDGDCCPESWINDGICDDGEQFGCDLTCYDAEINDCEGTDGDSDSGDTGEDSCGNIDWIGDGYCDGVNNFEECEFDGGDCCESTCISADYDCSETNGDWGPCLTNICVDPNGNNDGCEDNSDDSGGECEDGYVIDCSGDGDCCPENWIGDDYPDCEDQPYECDLSCYDNDGGDCETGSGGDDNGFSCDDLGNEACNWHDECEWTDNGCIEAGTGDDGGGETVGWFVLESTYGAVGSTVEVPLRMETSIGIAGFQFTIWDYPNQLTGIEFSSSLDEECWTANSNDVEGSLLGLVFSLNGCVIDSQESSIQLGSLVYEVSNNTEFGQTIELGFSELIVSDINGNAVDFEGIGSIVTLGMPGDVNMDNEVNVLDVVMIVNFILNPGSATDSQYASGDFNSDSELNVLDVVSVVNSILSNDALSRIIINTPSAELKNNTLQLNGDIGGIQVDGKIISQIIGSDQLMESDNRSILFNLNGKLETINIIFNNNPMHLIVSDIEGYEVSIHYLDQFSLNPVYPNPFNPETRISYSLFKDGIVNISVYDIQGQMIDQILKESQQKGNYEITWNANHFASGIYFLKVYSGNQLQTKKLVLIK